MKRFFPLTATLFLILVPAAIYFWIWDYLAVNIPKWDDHAFKMFLLNLRDENSIGGYLQQIFSQHNEHRIALTRLITWLDALIFGSLNFRHLMLAGNLLLLIIPVIWGIILHQNKKPLYSLIPVPFLWLTLAHWENMYWGMAAVQNFGIVALFVLTCFLLTQNKNKYLISAIITAFLTVYASGNGLLILPIGCVLLFTANRRKHLGIWVGMSIALVILYFIGFEYPSETNPENKANLAQFIRGYMIFLGSAAEAFPFQNKQFISLLLGSILFLVAVSIVFTSIFRLWRSRYEEEALKKADLFCLGICLFILGTAFIVVYGRAGFGMETLLTSRYKIYSFLLLLIGYLYVVIPIKGSFLYPYVSGITALTIIYNILSFHYHLADATNLRKYLTTSKFNWTYDNKELRDTAREKPGGDIVAEENLFYNKWLPLLKEADKNGFAGDTAQMDRIYKNTGISSDSAAIFISNQTYRSQRLQDSGVYVVLNSEDRFYLYPTYRRRNPSRKTLFLKQQYFEAGFSNNISMEGMAPGNYRLGIIWQQGDKTGIQFHSDSIKVYEVKNNAVHTNW